MASARKKQDEKNLKILRELVSLPGNKHCFDCNQRGPTYINMTIGSFVCMKCSGMLRGLTPPHRVKSISMASFTAEEVEFVKSKGNDVCGSTWLALYDPNEYQELRVGQPIKDFLVEKYDLKHYYHEGLRNETKITYMNNISKENINNGSTDDFVADFGSADIFSASQFNNNSSTVSSSQPSFANFDNNVIFNSANITSPNPVNGISNTISNTNGSTQPIKSPPSEDRYAALKDLDNALKTQQQQEQQQLEWGSNGSGYASPSPLYGSPSTTGSMYGSPSQGNFMSSFNHQDVPNNVSNPFSINGNGTRNPWALNGNGNIPPANNTVVANNCFTAFNNGSPNNGTTTVNANPFRDNFNGTKFNGVSNGFNGFQHQQSFFTAPTTHSSHFGSKAWNSPNPFTLGVSPGTGGTSNNPFL